MRKDRHLFDSNYLETMRAGNYDIDEAIAELIDNSVDANAKNIEILLVADEIKTTQIKTIVVADDGDAMDLETLDNALFLGNKMKSNANLTGKYGQGLKASTLKYCNHGTVFSKKNGLMSKGILSFSRLKTNNLLVDNAVKSSDVELYNMPVSNAISSDILFNESYTFILWEDIIKDTVSLEKAKKNLEFNIGRKFRKFITNGTKINIKTIKGTNRSITPIKAIDTLKLDKNFELVVPTIFKEFPIVDDYIIYKSFLENREIKMKIKFSQIKENQYHLVLKNEENSMQYKKEIDNLMGISFVRANREIELKSKFTNIFKPKNEGAHKYIGCEIVYDAENDDLFDTDAKKNSVRLSDTSPLFSFFEDYIGKSFYEIQSRNVKIARLISEEKKSEKVHNTEDQVIEHNDERDDYLVMEDSGKKIINRRSKILNISNKKLWDMLIENAIQSGDTSLLEKLEMIFK